MLLRLARKTRVAPWEFTQSTGSCLHDALDDAFEQKEHSVAEYSRIQSHGILRDRKGARAVRRRPAYDGCCWTQGN